MMMLKIAWRNVWRHPGRSLVIIASVIVGLWAGLFVMSFYVGFAEDRLRSVIETETSHLQLHHPEFKDDQDVKFSIPNSGALVASIRTLPQVRVAGARLIARGMIASASGSSGVQVNGILPAAEDSLTKLRSKVVEGKYFPGSKTNELIIGWKLAQKLHAKLGGKLIITMQDTAGNIVAGAYRVSAVFRTQNTPFDESNIYVLRNDMAEQLAIPGAVTEIAVLLSSDNDVGTVLSILRSGSPHLLVEDWRMIAPEMDLTISFVDQTMYLFIGIMLLAMAFGIINTMLMAVLERTREIGMLLSLGMNKARIFSMIMLETFFLVLTGAPIGLLIALASITYFGKRGIDLSMFRAVLESFGYANVIYTKLEAQHYVYVLLLVVVTAFLSSLLPARKALQLRPAEAIRK